MTRPLSPEMRDHLIDACLVETLNHMIEMLGLTPWWHLRTRWQLSREIRARGRFIERLRAGCRAARLTPE